METETEERVRGKEALRQLEEASVLLEHAAKSQDEAKISSGFPQRISQFLNNLTSLTSRDDAEKLLATGVSLWNSVIAFEGFQQDQSTLQPLVQVRHVAVDCMYMSTTVLGGISARFNIDDLALLKFYTACGQRYASIGKNMDMADVCFTKAAEFVPAAVNETGKDDLDRVQLSKAMFDLLLGRAECAWEKGDSKQAEQFIDNAHTYINHLPGKHEYLASVEYNFGLYTYEQKDIQRALKWLNKSIETRAMEANTNRSVERQAKSMRLAGVCLLAMQQYQQSWQMMKSAQDMHSEPVGFYLLLKLAIITKQPQALQLLLNTVDDHDIDLQTCMACVALFGDAQKINEAASAFHRLFSRFKNDPQAIACTIGPRYFQTLAALGKIQESIDVLDICTSSLDDLRNQQTTSADQPTSSSETGHLPHRLPDWPALLLATGSAQAERKDYYSASILLNRALVFARTYSSDTETAIPLPNVVLENEGAVCRLVSSSALCCLQELRQNPPVNPNGNKNEQDKVLEKHEFLLKIARKNAERAKDLDRTDYAPRLLLFRIHLFSQQHEKAAAELSEASKDIKFFDAGALAEAACAAKDVGSMTSVVAALKCILVMDPKSLSKLSEKEDQQVCKGFYGKVLTSCVHLMLDMDSKSASDSGSSVEHNNSQNSDISVHITSQLLDVLHAGAKGIKILGIEIAFDNEKGQRKKSILYLRNVSWNIGKRAGELFDFESWYGFFEACFMYSTFLEPSDENLQTQRMAKIMCASALIENPGSGEDEFKEARSHVQDARAVCNKFESPSKSAVVNPVEGLLVTLEARCCTKCGDLESLDVVIQGYISREGVDAGVIEQLAAIVHSFPATDSDRSGEIKSKCADLKAVLLSKAVDTRMSGSGSIDLEALAVAMREHLTVELSRGTSYGRAYYCFMKAVGVVVENETDYPGDERRWLVAIGWDRAEMFHRLGQNAEAKRWGGVQKMADGCLGLSSYVPRIEAFLKGLPNNV